MAYTPPTNPDFDFTEGDYTPPADSLEANFNFTAPLPPVTAGGMILGGAKIK
jgi:hypothetical protein